MLYNVDSDHCCVTVSVLYLQKKNLKGAVGGRFVVEARCFCFYLDYGAVESVGATKQVHCTHQEYGSCFNVPEVFAGLKKQWSGL